MSHRSEVVWRADQPVSRVQVNLDAAKALWVHYSRLTRMTITGKDPHK